MHRTHLTWRRIVAALVMALGLICRADEFSLVNKPVVGVDADGRLEVFRVDADGALFHRWQIPARGEWSRWSKLGGPVLPGVATATNAQGVLEVYAIDQLTHELRSLRQTTPNAVEWSSWISLGGELRGPITVAQGAEGAVDVFALGAGNSDVAHLWRAGPWGEWSEWTSLGGGVEPGVVAARNSDGRWELFGVATNDGGLRHIWERANGSEEWSRWNDLGGSILPGFRVSHNQDGRLEVFGVNPTNHAVNRICELEAGDSARWGAWIDFEGRFKTGLALTENADGRIEVFAVNIKDNTLWHKWQLKPDGQDIWSGWWGMGWPTQPYPAVGHNSDGNLELFGAEVDDSSILDHKRQIGANSDWLDWERMNQTTFRFASRLWQMDEGLPNNFVQAIAQTHDGFLWVGTLAGLARFDGMRFTTFDARNTPEIKNSSITALCATRDGALWVGSDGGGVAVLRDGVFSTLTQSNGLAGNEVRVIYEGKNALWVGSTTGMSRYQGGHVVNYTTKQGLLSDVVRAILEDRSGALWIATGGGLNRLTGQVMDSFPMPNGLPNDAVRAIFQDKGARIWIGSNNGMLWENWYDLGHFYAYNTRFGLSDSFVSAILEDHENNFWVGTYSGLNRFRAGRFFSELNNDGMPFDRVNALFEDNQGDIWVGSKEGLARLTPERFFSYTRQQGLTHNNVMSVREDAAGNIWAATWGGGLDCLRDDHVTALTQSNGLPTDLILSTEEGRDGKLWIGCDYDGGLACLQDGNLQRYTARDGLINAPIRVLHEDHAGTLWIGATKGLSRMRAGKFVNYTTADGLAGNLIRALAEDAAGVLWVGSEGGLTRIENGRITRMTTADGLSDDTVTALRPDKSGDLWIGTRGGGLDRLHHGKITAYTSRQGLFCDEIFEILDDDLGWLWMSSSQGVFRVRKSELDNLDHGDVKKIVSIAYGKNDGMVTPQCNGAAKPGGWKGRDGRLWFPTSKGLVVVDPSTVRVNRAAPAVFIEQVWADKRPMLGRLPAPAISPGRELWIPPGRGEVKFDYCALDYRAPEECRFRRKLEGLDADWVEAGTQRSATYNNLPPGSYTFHVAACNADGIWNEAGLALPVVVIPFYYQTLWFRLLLAGLAVGGAGAAARFFTARRMRRQLELLEQRHAIERERGRIAKDIHDDLGSSLTRIMMLGERTQEGLVRREDVAAHVHKIVNSARHTVQSLDEIVWAVDPENDTLEGLINYITHYADEFFENTAVSCRLEMPVQAPPWPLPAEVRHDLFLVVKEAFNNIVRHSGASAAQVKLDCAGDELEISIDDNGHGFNLDARGGNGLSNMRQRIARMGGQFQCASAPGQGTQLRMLVRLQPLEANGNAAPLI
ncbi:MAG TPA: two-component regulator propeller domain-containing protein [Verrucomicrobiae bacterium]|nr:two-component regulator propeller domain-containing protein [Verrucomicrobiae bacterium]